MIGAFRSVYRSKVCRCIVEYVGQYCESRSVCCLSVDVAAFDLINCCLSVPGLVFVFDVSQ